ncbi:HET-C-related protein [Pseudomonas caspiana]
MNPLAEDSLHVEKNIKAYAAKTDEAGTKPLSNKLARFAAGEGSERESTHGSIEAVLEHAGFRPHEIRAIYFGNWLRDYSQLLDPKIVRGAMPKNFPEVLSRDALTRIVDVLAVKEFSDLMKIDRERFRVTPERLGVYRPSEHIDNPKVLKPAPFDPVKRDADFEPWVEADDPLLEVDYQTSTKRYIHRSSAVMQAELNTALKEGLESTDGLRAFGSALHILEDFYAHSNYVELCLIKAGYTQVLPWTSEANCKHGLPLVTGMFGSTDVIASLAAPLGKILFSIKDTTFGAIQAGERTERDQVVKILLEEHPNDQYLKAYESFLHNRDKWAELPYSDYIEALLHHVQLPGQLVNNAFGAVMQGLLTVLGNSIDDAQTHLGQDPNTSGSTDPSHSQLAKDHGEHPLHELAALLAQDAVLRMGQTMLYKWQNISGQPDPARLAADHLQHPMDFSLHDQIVRDWALANPVRIKQASSKSHLDTVANQIRKHATNQLENFRQHGGNFLEIFLKSNHPLVELWKRTPLGWYLTRNK